MLNKYVSNNSYNKRNSRNITIIYSKYRSCGDIYKVKNKMIMKVKMNKQLWIMKNPDGGVYIETLAIIKDECWDKFQKYAVRKNWEKEGYKAMKVQIVEVHKEEKIEH